MRLIPVSRHSVLRAATQMRSKRNESNNFKITKKNKKTTFFFKIDYIKRTSKMEYLCVTMIGLFLWRLWAYFGLDSIGFVMMILFFMMYYSEDDSRVKGRHNRIYK